MATPRKWNRNPLKQLCRLPTLWMGFGPQTDGPAYWFRAMRDIPNNHAQGRQRKCGGDKTSS